MSIFKTKLNNYTQNFHVSKENKSLYGGFGLKKPEASPFEQAAEEDKASEQQSQQ